MSRSRSHIKNSDHQIDLFADDTTPESPTMAKGEDNMIEIRGLLNSLDNTEALLQHWQQAEWIRPLDVGFARLIRELSEEQGEEPDPLVLLLAALTSHQVGRGHVCIDLGNLLADAVQTLSLPPEESNYQPPKDTDTSETHQPEPAELLALVTLPECMALLGASCAVSDGSHTTPLVLNDTRLYLRRFWRYEQCIAEGIRQRLALPSPLADPESGPARTLSRASTSCSSRQKRWTTRNWPAPWQPETVSRSSPADPAPERPPRWLTCWRLCRRLPVNPRTGRAGNTGSGWRPRPARLRPT